MEGNPSPDLEYPTGSFLIRLPGECNLRLRLPLLIKSGEIAVDAGAANIVIAKNVFSRIESVICALRRQGEADCSPRFGAARAGPEANGKPVADTRPPERRPAANVLRLTPLTAVSSCLNAVLILFAIAPSVAASGRVTGCRG